LKILQAGRLRCQIRIRRNRILHRLITLPVLALLIAIATPLYAQAYPSKPVRIIVPFPPGTTLDIMSRLIAPALTAQLGQNIIVDNRAGAAGQLGLDLGAHAPADGYTLVGGQSGNLVVEPHAYRKPGYDALKDFAPVALSTTNFLVLVANPALPYTTLGDLIAYARASPGKLIIASNGEGGFPHLAIEMLRLQAGFDYLHVPFKSGVQIMTEMTGGRVDASIIGIASIAPYIRVGRVRLIAVTGPARSEQFPDTPTIAETLPGYDARGWFGYLAPAGTPPTIVALLNRAINRAMTAPEVKEKLNALGLTVVTDTPEAFAQLLKTDYAKYGKLIRSIGLQIN
jgi:tripartite-type tricarboxylate transporter receptor subunit TctC